MGKYDGLRDRLASSDELQLRLTFETVDALVGGLPPSARSLRTWWANSSHSQALAWRSAGWHVQTVDLAGRNVTFARGVVGGTYSLSRMAPASRNSHGGPELERETTEAVDARLSFNWSYVGIVKLDAGGKVAFPQVPRQPGLYRITLTREGARTRVYIGESDNLHRRLAGNYRSPGATQHTSLRVNAELREHLGARGVASVEVALEASLALGDEPLTSLNLGRKAARLLAENLAISLAEAGGTVDLVNLP
ncbi:hypothetical protein ACFUC1_08980 [Pedococcus sp. NPDC057267]|uniref:DUF7662 domain-containing protein n=1 Tax=Pedococcus sp. NPDC057267 TaxID=3346077 RepID=UPI0036292C38